MRVSASVLAAPLHELGKSVRTLDHDYIDLLHMDIMDGNFVPQLTFGEGTCRAISEITDIPLDIHLMVLHPENEVPKYFSMKPHNITFHYEATKFPIRLASRIKDAGIKTGISINPSTPVSVLGDILPFFDMVLLMSVEPGFAGQSFVGSSFERLEKLVRLRKTHNPSLLIEVDGGVDPNKTKRLKEIGVDIVVSGSFIFRADQPNKQALLLQ